MNRIQRLTLAAICLLLPLGSFAQELSKQDNKAIDEKVSVFLGLMETKSYTKVLDFIYPKFFEHSPKNQMFQIFQLLETSGIELKFNDLKILDKTKLPSEKGIDYALIKYSLNMELPLNTDELKGAAGFMVPMLQNNFGRDNVEYNKKDSYIKVQGEKFLLGVEDPDYEDWLFLIYDDSFKSAIEKTIPASVNQAAINGMN